MPTSRSPRVRIRVSAPAPPTPSSGLPDAPSWVLGLPINRFQQVATVNLLADIDPEQDPALNPGGGNAPWHGNTGFRAHIRAWNGGVLANNIGARGTYVTWGGGHKDYYGNEVNGLDLGTLTWARLSDPYPTPNDGLQATTGWHPAHTGQPNGSPGVPHTYTFVQYVPDMKCLVTPTVQKDNSGGGGRLAKIGIFPFPGSAFTSYQWQEGSAVPGGSYGPVWTDGWGCYDSTRKRLLTQGGSDSSTFASIDPSTGSAQGAYGTWTVYGNKTGTAGMGADYDPINDMVITFAPDGRLRGLDAANLSSSVVNLAQNAPPAAGKGVSVAYSYARAGFLVWDAGGSLYLLKMNAGAGTWRTNGWTWTQISTDTTVGPVRNPNGAYNRFRVMRYTNAEVALLVQGVDQNLWAFRLA